jgi:hypothetical protein
VYCEIDIYIDIYYLVEAYVETNGKLDAKQWQIYEESSEKGI